MCTVCSPIPIPIHLIYIVDTSTTDARNLLGQGRGGGWGSKKTTHRWPKKWEEVIEKYFFIDYATMR
jgi:hypothetical protein